MIATRGGTIAGLFFRPLITNRMSTSFLGLEFSQLNVARGICCSLGLLSTTMGLKALFTPASAATTFGIPSTSPFANERNLYITIAGGDRVANGLGTLLCLYFGEYRAIGLMMMAGSLVAMNDGICLRREVARLRTENKIAEKDAEEAEGKAWGHLFFSPVTAALGAWLFYLSCTN